MAMVAHTARFAPSPTGPLHLGHAYAAKVAHDLARRSGGRFLLRIEDIDRQRARPEWAEAITADLDWLGLRPDGTVLRQSDRTASYGAALERLWRDGLLYPCDCTRRDIDTALSATQEGSVEAGPDGPIYPGTCRPARPPTGPRPGGCHLRLDMRRAAALVAPIAFAETGPQFPGVHQLDADRLVRGFGDVVVARRDIGTSYHLAVVVDDADQRITLVTRGADLFSAVPVQVVLQRLLNLRTPLYHHHPLVRDTAGKRLAKRDHARSIRSYRDQGLTPADVFRLAEEGTAGH